MMTSVLRDSLGGNCKTVMIATINPEQSQTEESISTCRFAQRVSQIKNSAIINEDTDPNVLIRRLRGECAALTEEVKYLKGEAGEGDDLTSEEIDNLKQRCREYVDSRESGVQLRIGAYTLSKLKRCFAIFKDMIFEGRSAIGKTAGEKGMGSRESKLGSLDVVGAADNTNGDHKGGGQGACKEDLLSLQDALQQRDHEIAILVNMIKQGKGPMPGFSTLSESNQQPSGGGQSLVSEAAPRKRDVKDEENEAKGWGAKGRETAATRRGQEKGRGLQNGSNGAVDGVAPPADAFLLENPQESFTYFRERHPGQPAMEENKSLLSEKYARAKVWIE
ncbi:unnamed protein product [Choristocarpus tenellus]